MTRNHHPQGPIDRREFLRLGGIATATAFAGATGLAVHWKWQGMKNIAAGVGRDLRWSRKAHWSFEERITRHFDYLKLDPAGVRAFVADYGRHRRVLSRFREPRDDIFRRFLLSTDFFQNGADETREVRYVLFHDPYVNPCWNPCRVTDAL